ncbi:lysozyme [Streptomyces sp. NPDC088768]|uniref:lysozyme n=1 Tax=Streptomyces sp. NPDC088768 TaxID=3365894 RepID=UPI003816E7AB
MRLLRRTRSVLLGPAVLAAAALSATPALAAGPEGPRGHDVSAHQEKVNFADARAKGARFTYVKATESTTYRSPVFRKQYDDAAKAGLLRGAYHFALPDRSSGADQAAYFVRNGGDWRPDGRTLPPALDLEANPYNTQHKCYGISKQKMRAWISDFSDETLRLTGRRPMIYTSAHWWNTCTGRSTAFADTHPLWLANWADSPGQLPAGWAYWTLWQYAVKGPLPGDQNVFNGSQGDLERFTDG